MWCWRRLLRVPWTARRSNLSILKEISPEYSLEGLMLKLKLQYFVHLMRRTDTLEKTLMLGKIEAGGEGDNRGWDGWMAAPTQHTWVWANSGRWWRTEEPVMLQSMRSQRVQHDWVTKQQQQQQNCVTYLTMKSPLSLLAQHNFSLQVVCLKTGSPPMKGFCLYRELHSSQFLKCYLLLLTSRIVICYSSNVSI